MDYAPQTGHRYIRSLMPGDRFSIDLGVGGQLHYRLIYCNESRAYVEPARRDKRQITDAKGSVLAEFEDRNGRVNISPMTEVIKMDAEYEEFDLAGDPVEIDTFDLTGDPADALGHRKRAKSAPGTLRALDPATKRGQVVAMFKVGKTTAQVCDKLNIKKSCALSHMSDARKYNGVQYEARNGKVRVL